MDATCSHYARRVGRSQNSTLRERAKPARRLSGFCLIVLALIISATSVARADVDTMGKLREVSSTFKSSPGEVNPLVTAEKEDYECTAKYSDMQSGAFSWVIGNCAKGEILEAVVRRLYSDSEPEGNYALGGWVGGGFQGCGWIEDEKFKPKAKKNKPTTACSELSSGKYEVAESLFMGKHNGGAGDGYFVVNKASCPEYANYRPWSSNNVEKEPLRTAPAYATSGPGSNYPALKWRYTTKYNSTDGSGQYVMVRDDRLSAGEGNWVFVPRSCLPATLPENENERVPSPPTVNTGGISNLAPQSVTLHGTVNPNGLETKYHFEYWTNGSPVSTPEGNAGSGNNVVEEVASIGLQPGTTYHYRFTATSLTGTSTGSEQTFTSPCFQPEATTSAATGIQQTEATLNGVISPLGCDTHYYFQYGETTGYGSSTPIGDAGSGTTGVPESATLSGLQLGTTYHYRIVAENVRGQTSYGNDQTFATPALTWAPGEGGSLQQVFYIGSGGTVYEAYVTSKNEWITQSISSGYGASGRVTWAPGQSAVQEVFYIGSSGTVYEAYMTSKNEWITQSISSGYGASGQVTFANNQVFYVGSGGTLYEAYSDENRWITQSISSGYGASGQVTWATGEGGSLQQVFYIGSGGTVYEAYANPENKWVTQSISGGYGASGQVIWAPGQSAVQEVFYIGSSGTVYEAYMTSKNEWITQSISSGYGASGQVTFANNQVFYVGSGGTLYEAYSDENRWITQSISSGYGASGQVTWATGEGGSLQQVFYIGSGGTVYEAYANPENKWVTQSISGGYGASGQVIWAPGQSAVQEVFYIGSGGTVYEAYMTSKNEWITQSVSSGYGA